MLDNWRNAVKFRLPPDLTPPTIEPKVVKTFKRDIDLRIRS